LPLSRIKSIFIKELLHIIRDPRSLAIIFIMPIMMIVLYGYGISFDVKDIKMAVIDRDHSSSSRRLIDKFIHSGYFRLRSDISSTDDIEQLFLYRKIQMMLVIPPDFGALLLKQSLTEVQLIVDGSNANSATVVSNYAQYLISSFSAEMNPVVAQIPLEVRPRIWYNPELKTPPFIVPGLVAVLMMMICAMLTSITVAREKETGTMEQILVSPVRSHEIILGKVAPYIAIAFFVALTTLAFSVLVFDIPCNGSIWLLVFFIVVFIYASLSIGVLISSWAKTQQVALMSALVGTLLPSILFSGFIFPLHSMPRVLQILSYIIPAKYFLFIIRGIMLKGIGFEYLKVNGFCLFLFGTVLLIISVKNFRASLEG
jgi:ABC-2 type transport system permease protein